MFGVLSPNVSPTDAGEQPAFDHPFKIADFESRLKEYNAYYEGKSLPIISSKEEDGNEILSGPLRVYWGVENPIYFKENDEPRTPRKAKEWRRSYTIAIKNGLNEELTQSMDNGQDENGKKETFEELIYRLNSQEKEEAENEEKEEERTWTRLNTISYKGDSLRRRKKINRRSHRRLSMINGHVFNIETCVFTPASGSVTSVTVTSEHNTSHVIQLLLDKFKVKNSVDEFTLCAIKKTGEIRVFLSHERPLVERVLLGPLEEEAKVYIKEVYSAKDISSEVALYMSLPDPMLNGFLNKLNEEEENEINLVKRRYRHYCEKLKSLILDKTILESTDM